MRFSTGKGAAAASGFLDAFAALFVVAAAALALGSPLGFWLLLALIGLAGGSLLVTDYPVVATVFWLALIGSTPEYWLADLVGGASLLIGVEKLAGLGLAVVCIVRYGGRFDFFNPALAFAAIFLAGLRHGLHPRLEVAESVRSLAGSAAPFAFSFSRLSGDWASAVIRAVCWLPLGLVVAGGALALAGLHPLFVDQLGFRLQATGIPAFLGGFAETAVYACLLELFRGGGRRDLLLLGVNLTVLVLSGARAPLAMVGAVIVIATLCLPSRRFGVAARLPVLLLAITAVPLLAAIATQVSNVRLFKVLSSRADSMSGRDLLWPVFARAWEESPWFGWGLGAAKAVIEPDSPVAHLTGTTAPHNEYLRIGVEGGYLGLGLLIFCFAAWTIARTRRLPRIDRVILRLVMLGIAAHAAIDNLLISTTASVLFCWFSSALVRGALEQRQHRPRETRPAMTDIAREAVAREAVLSP